jgi:hypothetical protein
MQSGRAGGPRLYSSSFALRSSRAIASTATSTPRILSFARDGVCRWAADGRSRRGAAIPDRDGSRVASANSAHGMVPKVCVLRTLSVYRCVRIPRNLLRHFAADGRTASAADHVNSVRRSICHAFRKNPRQRCVSMTENSALFGSRPGGENLRIASATHDDDSVLQKGRHRWQSQPH